MNYKVEKDSKKFYFGKQEDYSKYRPTYPIELFEFLSSKFGMKNKSIVEFGAGTGKFAKPASDYCKHLYYVIASISGMLGIYGYKVCNVRHTIYRTVI